MKQLIQFIKESIIYEGLNNQDAKTIKSFIDSWNSETKKCYKANNKGNSKYFFNEKDVKIVFPLLLGTRGTTVNLLEFFNSESIDDLEKWLNDLLNKDENKQINEIFDKTNIPDFLGRRGEKLESVYEIVDQSSGALNELNRCGLALAHVFKDDDKEGEIKVDIKYSVVFNKEMSKVIIDDESSKDKYRKSCKEIGVKEIKEFFKELKKA